MGIQAFLLGGLPVVVPGLTRQSIFRKKMDARVKPAHDGFREDTRLCFLLKPDLSRGPCA
jgi:hypothetical protein